MNDLRRERARDATALSAAQADQLMAMLRDDDELMDQAIALGVNLTDFVSLARDRGIAREQTFGMAIGVLLAVLDIHMPPHQQEG